MYRQGVLRGDYLAGRRGDPGIFGAIRGAVSGGMRSLVTGGNPIAGAIAGGVSGARSLPAPASAPAPMFSRAGGPPGVLSAAPPGLAPGQTMSTGTALVGVSPLGTVGVASRPGYRPNRSGYYTRTGYVAPGSRLVRIRHMNVGNGRALKRALRRAFGFRKMATAVMSFALTGKKRGPGRFKARAHRGR